MKFLLSVALVAFFMTGTVTAQKVSFGIKGGLNVYSIHNNDKSLDNRPVTGFHIGALSHIHLAEKFALQPEVVFSTIGSNYKYGPDETRYNLSYINVPVLLQYMFKNGLRLQAGPQVSFLVHARSHTGDIKTDIREDFRTADFGLATGASYLVPNTGFGFDARFNLGLSDINKNGTFKSSNRGLQVGVFYLFNKK
ncbi:MAG: PorT family protein [Chitinophagaceae bacterium]|nr:PorT family protein [Chitinophagaceae bacterium]